MRTMQASPGLVVDLLPKGVNSNGWPAVRVRRAGNDAACVVYLPEVRALIDTLAAAAAETATMVVQKAGDSSTSSGRD